MPTRGHICTKLGNEADPRARGLGLHRRKFRRRQIVGVKNIKITNVAEMAKLAMQSDRDPEAWSARAAAAGAARLVMRLTLLHERAKAPDRVHRPRVLADRDAITLACDPLNALLQWTSGTLSIIAEDRRRLRAGRYVAIVEEVDRRMPASYAVEPVAIAEMSEPNAYVDSGPRFVARIVIFEDVALPTKPPT